jgi:uncharacterized membrane protein
MRLWFLRLWQELRSSYWFVPAVMSIAAGVLAMLLGAADATAQRLELPGLSGFHLTDAAGARAILSTLAGSAITVACVVFSIAMLVLSTASAQFGPRLLPNFMRQGGTQFVLGGFLATFIYTLVVLTRVRGGQSDIYVPQLSVAVALLLGVFSFALLVHFIQRVSRFIQAPRVIDDVGTGLIGTFRRLFPDDQEADSPQPPPDDLPESFESKAKPVCAADNGYLQAIDPDRVVATAQRHDVIVRLLKRPGEFVVAGHPLALVFPAEAATDDVMTGIRSAFLLGPERTDSQDAEFAVDQLVEVAVRALSPGINDPFTAIECIDWLGAALSFLLSRRLPSPYRFDQEGRLRVLTKPFTYTGIFDATFNQLRQHARSNEAVSMRLLETIAMLAERQLPKDCRKALLRHAKLIYEDSRAHLPQHEDRDDLKDRYDAVCERLRGIPA